MFSLRRSTQLLTRATSKRSFTGEANPSVEQAVNNILYNSLLIRFIR